LSSYADLISAAKEQGDGFGTFWATFPFSASAWSVDSIAKLDAVLLSPLHPLRLAWVAGVSKGVLNEPDADNRRRFAGVIEGWNIPCLGPAEIPEGRVVAVPIDNGPEQIFVGWSMLVRSSNQFAPLRAPKRVAGRRAPGSSISGLNGAAAAKAMSDYRQLNPFATTLTVDLAAASSGPRMESVDRAVVDEFDRWAKQGRAAVAGGARVWDSMHRLGEPPREYVAQRLNGGAPVTWSRYRPIPGKTPDANIRILQDAGHTVLVVEQDAEPLGSMGRIPFRRHEVLNKAARSSGAVDAVPGLRPECGWPPFADAVRAAEGSSEEGKVGVIRSVLGGAALSAESADWTVTGDAMLNPSALARQVAADGNNLALWEWRPPFLSTARSADDSLLERRPYLSVVRLPRTLITRIDALLQKSWGHTWGVAAHDVLAQLGSRGIGLSSLLAIGGAQARGALGFFRALQLLDRGTDEQGVQLVLPIDACDEYLTALSGERHELGDRRRADLLVVRLTRDEVVLVPLEIKYYGMDTPAVSLPAADARALDEPLAQLASTTAVLKGLEAREHGPLWNAALSALVEVGLRLDGGTSSASGWAADALSRVANGAMPIRIGRPLLTYFSHGSGTYRSTPDVVVHRSSISSHGQFIADPARVAQALFSPEGEQKGELISDWRALLSWAFSSEISQVHKPNVSPTDVESGDLVTTQDERASRAVDATPNDSLPEQPLDVGDSSDRGSSSHPQVNGILNPAEGQDASLRTASTGQMIDGDGVRFKVGHLTDSMRPALAEFWPANTSLTQLNMGVVGNLGTGKTQLVQSLVANLRRESARVQPSPVSILILDYKGDFAGDEFLDAVGGKLLRPHKLPVNYFELQEAYSPLAAVRKAGSFNDVLNQIFNIGPKQQNTLRRVILDLFKAEQAPTMREVLEAYRQEADYDSVVGVLEGWVLAEVFGDRDDGLEAFQNIMSDSVTVVSLLDFGSDQNSKNALVALFLNMYYEYMARLPKWPYQGVDPQLRRLNSFLLVDEATNIMSYNFDALNSILLQGREFGVGVILSSQYLSHFKSSKVDYAQTLRTWFIHSVPNVTTNQLQALGIPSPTEEMAHRIVGLPNHHALYSSLNYPGRFIEGFPFYKWVRQPLT
jgi:hypothetical protein